MYEQIPQKSLDRRKAHTNTYRCRPWASFLLDITSDIVAFSMAPEAMASIIACRLVPSPEMRMTSLDVMIGEGGCICCVATSTVFPHGTKGQRSYQRADYVVVFSC